MRLASVSVDLDALPHYAAIHGLPRELVPQDEAHRLLALAVGRFLELFERCGVKGTFFAVGEDLADASVSHALTTAVGRGMEVGNHTFRHPYALTCMALEAIQEEVVLGEEAIVRGVGARPVGFRAPGYTLTAPLLEVLASRGYRYDSSAFPSAPYYLAKAAVMGAKAVLGTPSRAILDSPRVLLAPRRPFWPARANPYRSGECAVLELPLTVSPILRFPFIGTFALTFPRPYVQSLYRGLRTEVFFNFELHAIDLLDRADGLAGRLLRHQRELGVPWAVKAKRLEEIVGWLLADYSVVTLAEAASRMAQSLPRAPAGVAES